MSDEACVPLTPAQLKLVAEAEAMMSKVLRTVRRRFRGGLSDAELLDRGRKRLFEAARRFRAKDNVPFEGYAWSFVHGAMWDAIREETRYQKTVRFGAYKAAEAQHEEPRSGGTGQVPSTAAVEGFSDAVVVGMMTEVLAQVERQRASGEVGARLEFAQARTALHTALGELSAQDRQLIELHYFQDVAIYLVGEPLKMCRTVVKARHRGVLKRLGARLRALGITAAPPTRGEELQEA